MTTVVVELAQTASHVFHALWLTIFFAASRRQVSHRRRVIRKMQEEGPVMSCLSCSSPMNREFTAEINIHFPGLSGLDKPTIWVFPRLSVCLGCGCAQFKIPDGELKQLQTR